MNSPTLASIENDLHASKRDERLAPYTTVKIGGPADIFFVANGSDELVRAVSLAHSKGVPVTLLGGGSNVLISDDGIRGLVIKTLDATLAFHGTSVTVGAGYHLGRLASLSAKNGLSGLESALGIPGTVGGAVHGNAGAFGWEMKDALVSVQLLGTDGTVHDVPVKDLSCRYRSTRLHETGEIVLSATLRLQHGDPLVIQQAMQQQLAVRRARQPLDRPSIGSTFRNVALREIANDIQKEYDMMAHAVGETIAAGYLLDQLELKGHRIGDAQVSERHANFLLNVGSATAEEIVMLISLIKQKVRQAYGGLPLHEEFHYLGF